MKKLFKHISLVLRKTQQHKIITNQNWKFVCMTINIQGSSVDKKLDESIHRKFNELLYLLN